MEDLSDDDDDDQPLPQRRRRSCWSLSRRELLGMLGNYLRLLALIGIISYSIYVQSQASSTHNWDDTRQNGFMESHNCNYATMRSFDVDGFPISNGTLSNFLPLIVQKPEDHRCISEETTRRCLRTLLTTDTGNSVAKFTSYFRPANRTYFPYTTFINVVSFISLILTVVYEFNEEQPSPGDFSSPVDKRLVMRVNMLLTLTIALLCIVACAFQTFVFEEVCLQLYNQDGAKEYCSRLLTCAGGGSSSGGLRGRGNTDGVIIGSVIRPTDPTILSYKAWTLAFAITLFLGLACKMLVSGQRRRGSCWGRVGVDSRNRVTPHDLVRLYRAREGMGLVGVDRVEEQARRVFKPWKVVGAGEMGSGECVICLNALFEDFDQLASPSRRSKKGYRTVEGGEGGGAAAVVAEAAAEPTAMSGAEAPKVVKVECEHMFHESCLRDWLRLKDTCPVCRHPIVVREMVLPTPPIVPPISPDMQADAPLAPEAIATPS